MNRDERKAHIEKMRSKRGENKDNSGQEKANSNQNNLPRQRSSSANAMTAKRKRVV